MKIKIISLLIILITSVSYGQKKVREWTLKECVEYALENNISIKQSELNVEDAAIDKSDAIGNFLPTINGSASHSWNIGLNQNITTGILENTTTQFTSTSVNLGVNIFSGLRNINRLRRSNLNILANHYQLSDMKDNISLNVANAYLQILFNKETLNVQNSQYNISKQDLERTKVLADNGVVPRGDVLEIEATVATQEQQIIIAENALRLSKISLAQLLLIDNYDEFDVAGEDYILPSSNVINIDPRIIFDKALEIRNDIKLSETNVEIAESDLKISRGALLPTISGFYGYSARASYSDQIIGVELNSDNPTSQIGFLTDDPNQTVSAPNFSPITGGPDGIFSQFARNDGHSFGLQLSVPILNGFSARNNVKRNKVNVERAKYRFDQDKLDLENTVNQLWNDARSAFKTYEAAEKTVKARRLAYDYARERFNVGLMNSFDFSQTQSRVDNAEAELVRSKYDYIFKLKVLEFYFGIPIDEL